MRCPPIPIYRAATRPSSATEVDGWQQLSRVSQNRAAVHSTPSRKVAQLAPTHSNSLLADSVDLAATTFRRQLVRNPVTRSMRRWWAIASRP